MTLRGSIRASTMSEQYHCSWLYACNSRVHVLCIASIQEYHCIL